VAKKVTRTEPKIAHGDRVMVEEEGLTPWEGEAGYVKWSAESGWWVEVYKPGVETYVMLESFLTPIKKES
jgi:hypothetical protein